MSASPVRMNLSASTDGKAIKITSSTTPGNLIHTATSNATPGAGGIWDEIWLYVCSNATELTVTVEFGDATSPDHNIVKNLLGKAGNEILVAGLLLQNSATVKVFTTSTCEITGFVNRITNT